MARAGNEMIKAIIGYKVRKGSDIEPVLNKLRAHAMTYPGFIAAENLRSEKESTIVAMIQSWDKLEDWTAWEMSTIRKSIIEEARPLILDEPRVTVYRVMATRGWADAGRGS